MAMRANLQFAADQSSRNDRIANTVTQVQRVKNARWVLMKDTGSDETKTVPAPADRIPAVRLVPCGMTPRNETSSADHVYVLVKVPSWALGYLVPNSSDSRRSPLFSQYGKIDTEKIKRCIAVNPPMVGVRLKNDDIVGLIGNITDRFAFTVIQGQLPGAADDIEDVLLLSVVNRDCAFCIDVSAGDLNCCPGQLESCRYVRRRETVLFHDDRLLTLTVFHDVD